MEYPDPHFEPDDIFDIEAFLRDSQHAQQQRLEDELEWIENRLDERDQIHEEIMEDLDSKLDWYYERLEQLYKQSFGKQDEKEQLKQRIEELNRRRHREKRKHWDDKQQLEDRRRDVLLELEELNDEIDFVESL